MTQHRLYLAFIRHGEYAQQSHAPSALQPYALIEAGEQQAQMAARQIQQLQIEASLDVDTTIISSPLLRAWQTAHIIGEHLGQPFQIEQQPALIERSVGALANLTIQQIEAVIQQDPRYKTPSPGWKSDSHYCLPVEGAESLMQAGKRVNDFIKQTLTEKQAEITQDTLIIMTGHGASFRHAMYLMNVLQFDDIKKLSMFHGVPLFFKYQPDQPLNPLKKIKGDWKQRSLNPIPTAENAIID